MIQTLACKSKLTEDFYVAVPKPRVADNAAKLEEQRLNKLMELQDSYKSLANDPALQKVAFFFEHLRTTLRPSVKCSLSRGHRAVFNPHTFACQLEFRLLQE